MGIEPEYPRVLVVGPEPFNYECGFGITISNLFADWPKDRLACLHFIGIPPDETVCEHNYGLGRHNMEWQLAPQYFIKTFRKAVVGTTDNSASVVSYANASPVLTGVHIAGRIKQVILRSGVGYLARVRLSEDLKTWVRSFHPDVIYCAVTDLTQIELVLSVAKLTHAAVVTHALDDWIMVPFQNENIFKKTLRYYTHLRLNRLYRRSSVCLVICEEMSRVYRKRYGLEFLSFFNCPNASYWLKHEKHDWRSQKPFRFVFIGTVYSPGNQTALVRFAEAIELANDTATCTFEIYSSKATVDRLRSTLHGLVNTMLHVSNMDTETFAKLCQDADALVLPMDFGESVQSALHLSMPTRLTPFLLSGTPIFAFAPPDTAVGRFFRERQTAYLVDKWVSAKELAQCIKEFIGNENHRRDIGREAMRVAATEFAGEVVRPRFLEAIRSAVRQDLVRT